MKIVFVVGSISDSHIIKRIEAFCERGFEIEVYGYTRDLNFTNKFKNLEPQIIGSLTNGKYLNRIVSGFREVSKIIRNHPTDTLYYVWGFDSGLVHLFRKSNYIYEISDIRYANFPFPLNYVFKCLDRWIIKNSVCTPITSEGFVRWIGLSKASSGKYVLLPNKLSPSFLDIKRKQVSKPMAERIKVGYAGLYRYPNTVLKLARIIGERFSETFEFHFWGKGDEAIFAKIKDLCNKYSNIYEHGPFKNPDDLQKVYDTFDIVACNYDIDGINERIAEPNKLYESIFFNKPIIVSEGTFLSTKVKELGIGYVVNKEDDDLVRLLERIRRERVEEIAMKEAMIDAKELVENYEELWHVIERYDEK